MTRRRSDSRAARPASAWLLARTVLLCAAGCGGLQVAFDDTRAGAGAGGMLTSAGAGGTVAAGNGGTGWPGGAAGVAGSQPTAGAGAPEGGAAGAGQGGTSDGAGQGGVAAAGAQGGAGAHDGEAGSINSAGQGAAAGEGAGPLCDPRPFRPEDVVCRTYLPDSCVGIAEGWRGCRGTGCKVCQDAIEGYPFYLDHYPCCRLDQNPGCGDATYRCAALCPEPTVFDTVPKCREVIDF